MKNDKLEKKLITAIEKAIAEVNVTYVHKKVKVTNTTYDDEMKKPLSEVVEDSEVLEKRKCEYDVNKIKTLTELWLKLKENSGEVASNSSGGVVILPEVQIVTDTKKKKSAKGEE